MKRLIILIFFILIFAFSIGVGYFYLNSRVDQKNNSINKKSDDNSKVDNNEIYTGANLDEKILQNAQIKESIFYKKCGHEVITQKNVSNEMVNLTEQELEKKIDKNTIIKDFSAQEINLYKEIDGMCSEHYIIGEENGMINIYKRNEDGEEELYDVTNIYLDYLPEDMKKKLKERIEVVGNEELNAVLENLVS